MPYNLNLPLPLLNIFYSIIIIISACIITKIGFFVLKLILKKWLDLSLFYPTIKAIWRVIVIIFALYAFLEIVFKVNPAHLLAAIGISGVTLGIAAQGFLKDILNGFVIVSGRNFQLGDTIIVKNSVKGRVDKLGIQSIRLVDDTTGEIHLINNSELTIVTVIKTDDIDSHKAKRNFRFSFNSLKHSKATSQKKRG
ncbi:MAG: mechanosensitive ion channel family protein [Clostridiales bacterium]|nr:mechanosensitive ion channel family protein [Clostridiales bacterium]